MMPSKQKFDGWLPAGKAYRFPKKVVFYLPSKAPDGNGKSVEMPSERRAALVRGVMNFLLEALGGATQIAGRGFFLNGKSVTAEEVILCYANCTEERYKASEQALNEVANGIAIEFQQQAIAVEVDGVMYLFSPTPKYIEIYHTMVADPLQERRGFKKYLERDLPLD